MMCHDVNIMSGIVPVEIFCDLALLGIGFLMFWEPHSLAPTSLSLRVNKILHCLDQYKLHSGGRLRVAPRPYLPYLWYTYVSNMIHNCMLKLLFWGRHVQMFLFFETFLVIRCCIRCVYQIWGLVTMSKCLLLWILPKATQTGHTNGKHLEREFSMEHLDASMRPVSGSGAKHIAAVKRQTEQQVCISLQEAVCLCPFRCRIFPKTCRFPWMLNNRAFRCWIEVRATNANSF